jgi:hypothetical protein
VILSRKEGELLSRVERSWDEQTVVCMATGPSLTLEQIVTVRASGAKVIVVNDAYTLAPFADVLYFADAKWHKWHKDRPEFRAFAGQKCSIFLGVDLKLGGVHLLKQAAYMGLSTDPGEICTGSNSGYQAVNIAVLSGAKRIVLIGYDGRAKDGKQHFFGDHPDKSHAPYEVTRGRFADLVAPTKKLGVKIMNATPGSWIECFPMVNLAESLEPPPTPAVVQA